MSLTRTLARAGSTLALGWALGSTAFAQGYVENPDAGQTVATASFTGPLNFTPVTQIAGALSPLGSVTNDVDLYRVTLVNPAAFFAIVSNTFTTAGLDTLMFILTANGRPVVLNDDNGNGTTLFSSIPAGSLANLAAQELIIGITVSGIEPVNAANQFLFASSFSSTDLRGPNLGAAGPLAGYLDAGFANTGGTYLIDLGGVNAVAVPEASTFVAGSLAAAAAGFAFLRRRRALPAAL